MVRVGVLLGVDVRVGVGVFVRVGVLLGVGVRVGVFVTPVGVGVRVGVLLGVGVRVGVFVTTVAVGVLVGPLTGSLPHIRFPLAYAGRLGQSVKLAGKAPLVCHQSLLPLYVLPQLFKCSDV